VTSFAFLHGGGQGSWVWDELCAELTARGAEVLALDVPGCGAKRGRDVAALSVADIVDELSADLIAWGKDRVVLVGHSQAGTILPLLKARLGERIGHLVYVSCAAPPPGKNLFELIGSSLRGTNPQEVGRPLDPATATREQMYTAMFVNEIDSDSAARFVAKLGFDQWPMSSMHHRDWDYDHLAGLGSTYVLCERDQALPPEWQERFAARLHCARVLRLDAGHQPMNTRPRDLADLLLEDAASC
jgi:pimeloyl-ACP methyl ester carboxylesterase